jgi:Tol biopolymer transport system component
VGRFLAFGCLDRAGTPGDTDGANDLFVWDRTTGTSVLATPGTDGLGVLGDPSISDDGRFVAYSYGTSATDGSTYLLDRTSNVTTLIATVPSVVAVSGDGSLVTFTAVAPDRPGRGVEDLFVWANPAA